MSRTYRQMSKHEREVFDAFYGGFCCCLSATVFGVGHGTRGATDTEYLEAMGTVDHGEILNFARRNSDPELPRIRKAIAFLKDKEDR